jgi:hypothetical protein
MLVVFGVGSLRTVPERPAFAFTAIRWCAGHHGLGIDANSKKPGLLAQHPAEGDQVTD